MSYDVYLRYPDGKLASVSRHEDGGTYALGGTTDAWLNITYNYGEHFYKALDAEQGLRWLYGKAGAQTVERLQAAVNTLGVIRTTDYWASTPGNAGHALAILLKWAREHPDAVWEGD